MEHWLNQILAPHIYVKLVKKKNRLMSSEVIPNSCKVDFPTHNTAYWAWSRINATDHDSSPGQSFGVLWADREEPQEEAASSRRTAGTESTRGVPAATFAVSWFPMNDRSVDMATRFRFETMGGLRTTGPAAATASSQSERGDRGAQGQGDGQTLPRVEAAGLDSQAVDSLDAAAQLDWAGGRVKGRRSKAEATREVEQDGQDLLRSMLCDPLLGDDDHDDWLDDSGEDADDAFLHDRSLRLRP